MNAVNSEPADTLENSGPQGFRRWNAVAVLVVLNVLVYVAQFYGGQLIWFLEHLVLRRDKVLAGEQVWTIFTYMFLHGSMAHIVMNMLGLWLLGVEVERSVGAKQFVGLFLLSGLIGGVGFLPGALWSDPTASCVGASGAVAGVLGAVVGLFPNRRLYIVFVPWFPMRAWVLAVVLATIHVFFMFTPYGGPVAYDVHLFGGLVGYFYALVLVRGMKQRGREMRRQVHNVFADPAVEALVMKVLREGREGLSSEEREQLDRLGGGVPSP